MSVDEELNRLVAHLVPFAPPGDLLPLHALAEKFGTVLPADYLDYMAHSDGGEGRVGQGFIQLWPVWKILDYADDDSPLYDDFLAFAGDGGNTLYGFDATRGGEIVGGEMIGDLREELTPQGRTLKELLQRVAQGL